MGLRTSKEYRESLRDGREVYMMGEKVPDVTAHPTLRACIDHVGSEYDIYNSPDYHDLAVVRSPETGEEIHRLYKVPRSTDDLLKRSELIEVQCIINDGIVTASKAIGADALFALSIAAHEMDKELNTNYSPRVEEYRQYCEKNDLALAGCVTDVKGNRSLRPGKQAHPDYYVRVVDRNKDGIVVRGAKNHISFASYANEMVVVPTRFMTEEDKDYAVAFAVPCNAKGLKFINRPEVAHPDNPVDFPISSKHVIVESVVVFDDVFIPKERVFLDGEWQASALAAHWFGNWHRYTAVSYKGPEADILLGCALLIAQSNGVDEVAHIRDEIIELVCYADSIRAFRKAAAMEHVIRGPNIACPNPLYTNAGKYYFAANYGKAVERVLDIAGGLVATCPSGRDYDNPETRGYLEKYLGGKEGALSTKDRMKVFKLIWELCATGMGGFWPVASLHAEGSLAAQRLAMYRELNAKYYTDLVKKSIGIT